MNAAIDAMLSHPRATIVSVSAVVLVVVLLSIARVLWSMRQVRLEALAEVEPVSRPSLAQTRVMPRVVVPAADETAVYYRVLPVDERGRRG